MTPPPPLGTTKKVSGSAFHGPVEVERKQSEQAIAKMQDFLREYIPGHFKNEKDVLNGYMIDLSKPMQEFDTEFSRAYEVKNPPEPNKQFFAQICDQGHVQRYQVMEALNQIDHRAVMQIRAYGQVPLTAGNVERMAVIYEVPQGRKLSELIKAKKFRHNSHFLLEHVLIPLLTGLECFTQMDISHGLINPDNIYFDEQTAILGPCVTEPCGYAQPFLYESVERMQAHPSGKGEGSILQDYYALAVTLLYILHGPEHFAGFTRDSLMYYILKDGPYQTLMRDRDVPEIFYDFLRGILTLSPEERWTEKQLRTWLGGKRYNVLPPPTPSDGVRPFEFKDMQVNSRRELANLFAHDWMNMLVALQGSNLSHWVTVSLRNKELADQISRLCRGALEAAGKNDALCSEILMNIVLLLDQIGPLRIRELGVHVEGINTLFVDMYTQKMAQELQFLAKFIETNMINYWIAMQEKRNPDFEITPRLLELMQRLDKLRSGIRNSGFGFGMERILYDLNPDLPCQSELFDGMYVRTLPQMLKHLDRLSSNTQSEEIVDKHIAAFIASKLMIHNEIRLNEISSIPALATSRHMIALYLLAMAQNRIEPMRLPGLTNWFAIKLLPLMDSIHSKTLRQKMKTMITSLAPLGLTQKLADLMITADYAEADCNGFEKALQTYQNNTAEIFSLKQPERLEQEAHRMGLNMASTLAYAGMIFSALYFLRGLTS